jgi:hypothetical protein
MSEQGKNTSNSKQHGIILGVIGVIALIAGIAIVTIHGPLRGSGLGTALIILGIIIVAIGVVRFSRKSS